MSTNESYGNDLIAAFRQGDQEAINVVYHAHFRPLCYFARNLVNSKEEAEDIVVETFIKLLRKRNDFDSAIKIKGFLYAVTRNACLDFLKHTRRKTVSHKEIIYLMEKDEDFVQSRIIKAELLNTILAEVENLPPVRRNIFKLIFVEELSTAEIAEKLNITIDTVRVQKARALHSIRANILKKGLLSVLCNMVAALWIFLLFV